MNKKFVYQVDNNKKVPAQVCVVIICMLKCTMPACSTHDTGSDTTHLYAQPFTDQFMNKPLNGQTSLGNQQMPVAGNMNS